MKIALLCSGLGNVRRGHEVFARGLFDLLSDELDITLFKGGGEPAEGERVIPNLERSSPLLDRITPLASPKWEDAARAQERERIEAVTFAYAALKPLLEGEYDVIHCLERDVCEVIHAHRHLFASTPRLLFSNGGAIPAAELPPCDFVQEHSDYNLARSDRKRAFVIPHGVDGSRFHPGVETDARERFGIPADARLAISVGTICYHHKRMDHVIRELAPIDGLYLLIAGQESADSPAIRQLGQDLMGDRVVFTSLSHDELPAAYAAADFFVLGSLFETFGIVYIEAMAMGLPVISTDHPNQQGIIKEGVFVDMATPGKLREAVQALSPQTLTRLRAKGPEVVRQHYDLAVLKGRYVEAYRRIADTRVDLPRWTLRRTLMSNARNLMSMLTRHIRL